MPLRTIDILYRHTIFTSVYNCAGLPAATVPLTWSQGLPIGVQIAAPLGEEARLLALAGQMEAARPWAQRRPG